MASSAVSSIAVLGAGATGLAAAHRLTRLGHRARVFEAADCTGGAVRTEHDGGWLVEAGPNTLLSGEPTVAALIDELGLAHELLPAAPAAQHRYLVRRGRLFAAPRTPAAFLLSPLFSPLTKLRACTEVLSRPRVRTSDLSVAALVRSHFGSQFVSQALDPFVSGIFAGDTTRLSAKYAFPSLWEMEQKSGSLLRGTLAAARTRRACGESAPQFFSFRRGLQSLTDALSCALPPGALSLHARLETLIPGDGGWNVVWHDGTATRTESFDAVIVAQPAPALARLRVGPLGERPLAALEAMEHAPVASLFLGFRRERVAHPLDGFGLLVPAAEHRPLLGVLFTSTLFPARAPAGHVALTVMAGGTRAPGLARLSPESLLAAVTPELQHLLGASGAPAFVRHHVWPHALPQYHLGHERFLAAFQACERAHPGLCFGGQARDGVSLPACLAAGEKLARQAVR